MINIPDCLSWESINALANSAFTTSLIGALAGACAGAWAAQRIAERSKERDQLIVQIRATNAATMVAFSVCNAGIALKEQIIRPMHDEFILAKTEFEALQRKHVSDETQRATAYKITADMKTIPAPSAPIETLKDLVFHRISAYGRPLALVAVLEQSFSGIKEMLARRDALIHRFASEEVSREILHCHYFGIPLPGGNINQEYPDLIVGIHSYVDDIIFFSALLCADLIAHGNRSYATFAKQFGKGAPKVSTVDFAGPRKKGVIPPDTQYLDWMNAFDEQGKRSDAK